MDDVLQEAVRRVGGLRVLARALGVSHQAILQWDRAPPRRVLDLERLTGIPRHDLRPDLYSAGEAHAPPPVQPVEVRDEEKDQRHRATMETEIQKRVQAETKRHIEEYLMPVYGERLAKAELVMKLGKPFTNKEYLSILRALHPDSSSDEYRNAAFRLMKERQVLLRPEEKDRPLSGGLPTTLAEMLAAKKTKR